MIRFALPRLAGAIVTLWIALTAVFLIGNALGDPVVLLLGEAATPEQVEALRAELGFDRPLLERYGTYLGDLVRGDLGTSLRYARPNTELLASRLPFTLQLAGAAVAIGIAVGIPLGILAGYRPGSLWDRFNLGLSVLLQSIPLFWLGLMLILVFAVGLGWFPATGANSARSIVLPAVTLSIYPIARFSRLTASSMRDALSQEYIASARARGLSERRVVLVHAFRNAALPVLTLIGLQAGALLSGAVTVEFVFGWPGLGQLATNAVAGRDITLVQAVVLVGATAFIAINLVLDLVYGLIDPRIRES